MVAPTKRHHLTDLGAWKSYQLEWNVVVEVNWRIVTKLLSIRMKALTVRLTLLALLVLLRHLPLIALRRGLALLWLVITLLWRLSLARICLTVCPLR